MVTASEVKEMVSRHYGVPEPVLMSRSSVERVVEARQAAAWLCRKVVGYSYPRIARSLGRDHSTIMYSVRKIDDALRRGAPVAKSVKYLFDEMTGAPVVDD
jgi:chromosomal replication initiator protein